MPLFATKNWRKKRRCQNQRKTPVPTEVPAAMETPTPVESGYEVISNIYTDSANAETTARFQSEPGRVVAADGTVTDYSDKLDANRFSLSEYYDIASYGNLTVQSFMTDWYQAPYNFTEMKDSAPDEAFMSELLDWLYKIYYDVTYSGIDAVGGYDMQSGNYGDWNAYSNWYHSLRQRL